MGVNVKDWLQTVFIISVESAFKIPKNRFQSGFARSSLPSTSVFTAHKKSSFWRRLLLPMQKNHPTRHTQGEREKRSLFACQIALQHRSYLRSRRETLWLQGIYRHS